MSNNNIITKNFHLRIKDMHVSNLKDSLPYFCLNWYQVNEHHIIKPRFVWIVWIYIYSQACWENVSTQIKKNNKLNNGLLCYLGSNKCNLSPPKTIAFYSVFGHSSVSLLHLCHYLHSHVLGSSSLSSDWWECMAFPSELWARFLQADPMSDKLMGQDWECGRGKYKLLLAHLN